MSNTAFKRHGSQLEQALGHLVVEFGRLETSLGCAVGYLVNPKDPRVGHILVGEVSFKTRMAAFSVLYPERLLAGTDETKMESFVSRAYKLEEERNRLIHSFYRPGPVGDPNATRIKTTAKGRKGLRVQFEKVTADSIAAVADDAARAKNVLTQLMVKFGDFTRYSAGFYGAFKQQKSSNEITPPDAASPS